MKKVNKLTNAPQVEAKAQPQDGVVVGSENIMEVIENAAESGGSKAVVNKLTSLADNGDGEAAYLLAQLYYDDNFSQKDEEKGHQFMLKSVISGFTEAMVELGSCFMQKGQTAEDQAVAFKYLHEAALKGHTEARLATAYCYHRGIGCHQSDVLSSLWTAQALTGNPNFTHVNNILGITTSKSGDSSEDIQK